jgi:hypothetical protein
VLEVFTHACKRISPEGMTGWLRACDAHRFQGLHRDSTSLQPFHGLITHVHMIIAAFNESRTAASAPRATKPPRGRMIEIFTPEHALRQ